MDTETTARMKRCIRCRSLRQKPAVEGGWCPRPFPVHVPSRPDGHGERGLSVPLILLASYSRATLPVCGQQTPRYSTLRCQEGRNLNSRHSSPYFSESQPLVGRIGGSAPGDTAGGGAGWEASAFSPQHERCCSHPPTQGRFSILGDTPRPPSEGACPLCTPPRLCQVILLMIIRLGLRRPARPACGGGYGAPPLQELGLAAGRPALRVAVRWGQAAGSKRRDSVKKDRRKRSLP